MTHITPTLKEMQETVTGFLQHINGLGFVPIAPVPDSDDPVSKTSDYEPFSPELLGSVTFSICAILKGMHFTNHQHVIQTFLFHFYAWGFLFLRNGRITMILSTTIDLYIRKFQIIEEINDV